jgi:Domain of unknown function (DUF4136)
MAYAAEGREILNASCDRREGGFLMDVFKGNGRWAMIGTVLLSVLIVGGCAPTVKYAFDAKTSFAQQKTYTWGSSSSVSQADHLLEANVQGLADQILSQKGFKKTAGQADLLITMNYESGIYVNRDSYKLRTLTLNIYKNENKELVWRGTAFGTINTDAASGDLKQAVQDILSNFPPKGQ